MTAAHTPVWQAEGASGTGGTAGAAGVPGAAGEAAAWAEDRAPQTTHAPLQGEVDADVVVVGAGFTGLTLALLLQRAGKRVVVLERDRVASGESGRSTAHMTAVLDTGLARLRRDFRPEGLRTAVASNLAAIDHVEAAVRELGIHDAAFRRLPGYIYTEDPSEVQALRKQAEAGRDAGLTVEETDDVPLPFPTAGGLRIAEQARINPVPYLAAIAEAVEREGGVVHERSPVREVDEGPHPEVRTEGGLVKAREVVLATHTPIGRRVQVEARSLPHRTYAIAARYPRDLDGMFWDTEDPYHYTRTHAVAGDTYLIVGGEDHRVGEPEAHGERHLRLEDYARRRFGIDDVAHAWSGQIIETSDGLPYIGRYPGERHTWIATGYAGNGTTHGTMAALLLADLLLGRENPWAELYDPGRLKPLAGGARTAGNTLAYVGHLVGDRVVPSEARHVEEIQPGQGRVITVRGERLAVFRDEQGALTACSAVCTHMQCMVRFNASEKSWDCPCHGSRFDVTGRVLNGPASEPLERREPPRERERPREAT